jgi:hypothetical protein
MFPGQTASSSAALAFPAHGRRVSSPYEQMISATPLAYIHASGPGSDRGHQRPEHLGAEQVEHPGPGEQ